MIVNDMLLKLNLQRTPHFTALSSTKTLVKKPSKIRGTQMSEE